MKFWNRLKAKLNDEISEAEIVNLFSHGLTVEQIVAKKRKEKKDKIKDK